jgi:chemotaxis receptor (MCP) glutamine deamidase CheD
LQAKIFGGSSAFAVDLSQSVGSRNVELAESFLRSAGIPVVEREVSGKHGRRLFFQIFDGVTKIKSFDQL